MSVTTVWHAQAKEYEIFSVTDDHTQWNTNANRQVTSLHHSTTYEELNWNWHLL